MMVDLSRDIAPSLNYTLMPLVVQIATIQTAFADEYAQQLLTVLLRREAVEEEVYGVVRIGQDVNEILHDVALALLTTIEYKGNAVGQLRQKEVENGYEKHVEDLALFFRPLVDVETTCVRVQVGHQLADVALVGLAHCAEYEYGADAHDNDGQERVDDDVDVEPIVDEECLVGAFDWEANFDYFVR